MFDQSMQWLSRTIAVVIVMVCPGLVGLSFDRRLGTQFLTPVGFLIGTVLATVSLLVLAQKFTPPAAGKPIPFEDENQNNDDDRDVDQRDRKAAR